MSASSLYKQLRSLLWANRRLLLLALVTGILAASTLTKSLDPRTRPMSHNTAAGSIVNARLEVELNGVRMCACWTGPNGQMQKKVKFEIVNNTKDSWLDLYGGKDGSVYLYVAYHEGFHPVVRMPTLDPQVGSQEAVLTEAGSPPNATVTVTEAYEEVVPDKIEASVAEEIGLEADWTAWAIPANANTLTTELSEGSMTFPTWATQQWLGPGESYFGEGNGVGAWVFYIPVPDEIAWIPATTSFMPASALSSEHLDQYYRVIGVGIRDRDGRTIGFSPTPPESSFSHASSF